MPLDQSDLSFWGKAQPSPASAAPFHPVAYHVLDVAAVAERLLLARPIVARRAADLLGMELDDGRTLLVALAALHDLGKFAPAFQAKAPTLWPVNVLGPYDPAAAVMRAHTEDGIALWEDGLAELAAGRLMPGGDDVLAVLAPAIFGHHGRPVGAKQWTDPVRALFRGGLGPALRCADTVLELLCACPLRAAPGGARAARLASWWVAGFMTVADWIGSNSRWFPYEPVRTDDLTLAGYWADARQRAERAVCEAGLVSPVAAPGCSFSELTGLAKAPTPVQEWAATAALPDGPLLIVIEDVTGSGKTEAAQMLVHRLMASGRVSGAYWAMPTMATANAMYDRQARAIERLFAPDGTARPSLVLAHGSQRLHEGFRSTVFGPDNIPVVMENRGADDAAGEADLPSSAACTAFLADDRRAALLADVGAGTVDQALLGILPSRFNAVRLFGLSDKVVVVDEAHAYDAYMGVEVQELLRFQAAFGGCAIILSATLSHRQREAFAQVWTDGTAGGLKTSVLAGPEERIALTSTAYPLATLVSAGGPVREVELGSAPWSVRSVSVRLVHDFDAAVEHVHAAAAAGGAVAWVRNTVDDCLAASAALRARGLNSVVFHARFAQGDRQRREKEVLARLRREAPAATRCGTVVAATQVIEQSLDLDFDAMVSDIAPIDLLVQRAGRLWRHPERDAARPPGLKREFVVLSPQPTSTPPETWLGGAFKGTAHIYEDAGILWRTVRALADAGSIETPGGLRNLIESVYDSDEVPPALLTAAGRAAGREGANAAAATYATLKPADGYHAGAQAWLSDIHVPTRLGQEQTTIRLARVTCDGTLVPWTLAEGPEWRSWALSEVRVSAYRVPAGSVAEEMYSTEVARVRTTWGRFEQEIPVLPLVECRAGGWEGTLILPDGKRRNVLYDSGAGLAYGSNPNRGESA